jgi:hypothetical protein
MNRTCAEQERLGYGTGDGRPFELSHQFFSLELLE